MIHVIQAHPPVVARSPYEGSGFLKPTLAITGCDYYSPKISEKRVAASVHGFNIANRVVFLA